MKKLRAAMRIGIDARGLSRQRAGLENFALGLIRELPLLRPDYSFFLYSNRQMNTKLLDPQFKSVVEDAWRLVPEQYRQGLREPPKGLSTS